LIEQPHSPARETAGPGSWLRRLASDDAAVPWRSTPSSITWRELALAFVVLLLVAVAVYLPHALTGGLYTDDWWFLQRLHFIDQAGGSISQMLDVSPFPGNYHDSFSILDSYRPGQTVMLAGQYLVAGDSPTAHLLLAPPLVAIQSLLLYLVTRLLGLRPLVAGAAALMLAIGTFVDTTRLWSAVQPEMNATSLYLGGLACALVGLRSPISRRRIIWHASAVVLYLAAAFTYEGFLVFLPLSALAYLLVSDRRAALRRWMPDLLAFGFGLATVARTASNDRSGQLTVSHVWHRVEDVVPGAIRVFRFSLPGGDLFWGPVGILLALATILGIALAIGGGGAPARAARQWCAIFFLALALAFVGLGPLLTAGTGLTPGNVGFANRLIATASPLYAVLFVAVGFLTAIGLMGLVRRPRIAAPLAIVGLGLITAQMVQREIQRQDDLATAWDEEERIAKSIQDTVPDPAPGDVFVSFRHPLVLDGGQVSFGTDYDLDGALKLRYGDESIRGHPFLPGGRCEASGITFSGLFEPPITLPYGQLFFIDTERRQSSRIETRAQCAREARRLNSLPAVG
jgi:hypothetical protein